MDLHLQGKRALVCASSQGIGKAIAELLSQEGATVVLCARNQATLDTVASELRSKTTAPVYAYACDLSDTVSRTKLIQFIQDELGGVDIVIHNTGGPQPTSVEETTLENWETGFQHLFMSVVHLNQAFLPVMKQQQWGRIITITSLAAVEPVPALAISNSFRAALTAMSKTLANEVTANGITVNCIAPGYIATDRVEELFDYRIQKEGTTRKAYMTEFLKTIPAGRLGSVEELASLVAYLCSPQAGYISGNTLAVDGSKRKSSY